MSSQLTAQDIPVISNPWPWKIFSYPKFADEAQDLTLSEKIKAATDYEFIRANLSISKSNDNEVLSQRSGIDNNSALVLLQKNRFSILINTVKLSLKS